MRHTANTDMVIECIAVYAAWENPRTDDIWRKLQDHIPCRLFKLETLDTLSSRYDLLISIGGDGLMISSCLAAAEHDIAVIGIHLGLLGFLNDLNTHDCINVLHQCLKGEFSIEERSLLLASLYLNDQLHWQHQALNDIVLHRGENLGMIRYQVFVGNEFMHSHRADGMIISSATGSTAYALSAGGPIIDPNLDAFLLLPLASHSVNVRPIVLSANKSIRLVYEHHERSHAAVYTDGHLQSSFHEDATLVIERSQYKVKLMHPLHYGYLKTVKTKLGWQ